MIRTSIRNRLLITHPHAVVAVFRKTATVTASRSSIRSEGRHVPAVIAHRRGSFVRFDHRLFAVRTWHLTSCANVAYDILGVLNDGPLYQIVDIFKGGNGSISSADLLLGSADAEPIQCTDDSAPIMFDFSLSGIAALQARKVASRWLETVESMSQHDPISGSGNRTYNGILYNWLTLFRNALNCATV